MIKVMLVSFVLLTINHLEPLFVKEFHNLTSKKMEQDYIDKYHNSTDVSIQAYIIALKMKQAKYSWNPIHKITIFKKQKEKLNDLIKIYPNNIHLRYIRFLLQEQTPKILNYKKHLNEDKEKLKYWLKVIDSTDYLDKYIKQNTSL